MENTLLPPPTPHPVVKIDNNSDNLTTRLLNRTLTEISSHHGLERLYTSVLTNEKYIIKNLAILSIEKE